MPPKSAKNSLPTEKEILFDLIASNLGEIIAFYSQEGKRIYITPVASELLGYPAEEVLQWGFGAHVHQEDVKQLQNGLEIFLHGPHSIYRHSFRHRHGNGHYLWLEMTLKKLPRKQPGVEYMAVFNETSTGVLATQEVLYRQRLLENTFHFFPCSILLLNKENMFVFVNQFTLDFFGVESQDLYHKSIYELFPVDGERYARDNALVWQTGKEMVKEDIFRTRDKIYIVLIGRKLIQTGSQDETLLLTYAIDITERKMAEREIELNRNFIRSIAYTLPDILYVYDLEENKYIFTNNGFEKVLGYTTLQIERMGDKLIQSLVHPEDAPQLANLFSEIAKNETDFFEYTYRLKDTQGNYRWFHSRKMVFKKNGLGQVTQILGFVQDINLRKQAEEAQQKAQQAIEAAMRAKNDFFSVTSHEIRTPMNAVIGMTHLLLQNDPRPDQLKLLQTLEFSGQNLLSLLNDLLDFSKIEAGKIEFSESDFNLPELIHTIFHIYKAQSGEKNLSFTLELDPGLPGIVKGDSHRLSQILSNLLSNAIKFTHRGGISLSVTKEKESGDYIYLWIRVKDTGMGIPPEKLHTIFEPFKQADSHTSRNYGGTGLGLAIIKSLAEHQGGHVIAESIPGQGSTFSVYYRFKKSSIIVSKSFFSTKTETFASLQGLRVLYVEDVISNQILLEEICKRWDVALDIASNGYEALRKFQQQQYDLVLMDIQMPGMDGYETTQYLRKLKKGWAQQVPITALTADTSKSTRSSIAAAGMNDYLTKPLQPDALYKNMKKYAHYHLPEQPEADPGKLTSDTAVAAETSSPPTISFDLFDQLFLKTPKEYIGFLQTYHSEFENYHQDFVQAVMDQDYGSFRPTRHKITTAIHHLKAERLKEVLSRTESYLKENNSDSFSSSLLIIDLHTVFKKINEELEEKIGLLK